MTNDEFRKMMERSIFDGDYIDSLFLNDKEWFMELTSKLAVMK